MINQKFKRAAAAKPGCNELNTANPIPRKITQTQGSFSNDYAAFKLFNMALNIMQKRTMPIRQWKAALNRFTVQFDERAPRVQVNII